MNSSGTVIGKGICIRGEVSGQEDFFLDGVLEGNIDVTGKRLTVGANGVIHADIVTGDLVVFGRVEGSVKATGRAELKHSAVFIGDISAARLSIEDNATLQGYVDLTEAIAPPKKGAVAHAKQAPTKQVPTEEASEEASEEVEQDVEQYSQAV
jgi:cytoskeletal protein CcmA (bactofilin family)